ELRLDVHRHRREHLPGLLVHAVAEEVVELGSDLRRCPRSQGCEKRRRGDPRGPHVLLVLRGGESDIPLSRGSRRIFARGEPPAIDRSPGQGHEEDVPLNAARMALGLVLAASSLAAGEPSPCPDLAIVASPAVPAAGRPLRIVVAADEGSADTIAIESPSGGLADGQRVAHAGPPWSVIVTIARPARGTYRVMLRRDGVAEACGGVSVADAPSRPAAERVGGGAWASRLEWSRKTEALYAAWIEHLFDAAPETDLSFPSLEPVLRDPARNFLHDHLSAGEDDAGPRALPATPDCADLPYLLRAYFAWKLGLPFGFRRCGRESATTPPRCGGVTTNEDPAVGGGDPLAAFTAFAG